MSVDIYHMHDGVECPNTAVANRLLAELRAIEDGYQRDLEDRDHEIERLRGALRAIEATVCRCDWDDQGNPDPPDPRCEMHGRVALVPENDRKRVPVSESGDQP